MTELQIRAGTGTTSRHSASGGSVKRSAPGVQNKHGYSAKHSASDARPAKPLNRSHAATWSTTHSNKLRLTDGLATLAVLVGAYLGCAGMDGSLKTAVLPHPGYLWIWAGIVLLWNFDLEYGRSREQHVLGSGRAEYRRVAQSTFRTFAIMICLGLLLSLVSNAEVPWVYLVVSLLLGLVVLLAERWIWRLLLKYQRDAGKSLTKVVVLGSPKEVAYMIAHLQSHPAAGYKVTGTALTTLQQGRDFLPPWYKIPVLSAAEDIAKVVRVTGAEAVVVAGALPGGSKAIQELGWRLGDLSVELLLASSLLNVTEASVHLRPVGGLPLMRVELPRYSGGKHIFKRVMDLVLSAAALLVLLPVLLVLMIIIRVDSRGPAFFFQERVGRNGEPFMMVKFRSMVVDAEQRLPGLQSRNEGAGVLFKISNDPRITRCGQWMRKYSLDELPQFWNVLCGNMSLVGPRPPLAAEVARYERPAHRRLLVKPGITGLWQVSGRSDLPWDEAVRLDLHYVENWSLTGDMVILLRTFKAVVEPVGAY